MQVTVTGMRAFRVRVWLACQLIALAGLVGGFNIEVDAQIKDQYGRNQSL